MTSSHIYASSVIVMPAFGTLTLKKMNVETNIRKTNNERATRRWVLNNLKYSLRGERVQKFDDETHEYTVGFTNLTLWNPKTQSYEQLSQNPDKFLLHDIDLSDAWSTFWVRLAIYTTKRFGYKLYLESITK